MDLVALNMAFIPLMILSSFAKRTSGAIIVGIFQRSDSGHTSRWGIDKVQGGWPGGLCGDFRGVCSECMRSARIPPQF